MRFSGEDEEQKLWVMFSFRQFFRINDWWRSKAALLMGMVYLFTAWFGIGFENFIRLALLSLATISGFASLGYLLNDYFDREKDALAGKKNFLEGKSPLLIALLFLVSLSLLLLPWKYLPFNTFSAALIFLEIVLFITYSLPPLRLKEKGMLGVVADALYAHAVPVVLAAYTFSLTAETTLSLFPTVLLFVWQMVSGIRNILLHQADDLDYDKKSKVKNFVAGIYPNPFKAVIWNLIRLELLFCLFFFSILSLTQPLFLISVFSILFVSALAVLFHEKGIAQLLKGGWRFFPNNISEKWLPPSVLIALSIIDIRYITILLLHFSLFNVDFYVRLSHFILPLFHTLGKKLWELFAFIRIISSAMLNYSIYYSFLLFGIDLRKEKTSALRYLKKLRNHSK